MRVAVVGGGLFGCTVAIHAKRAGHEVHLFEIGHDIMQGASGRNYFRLHRGYHYPRSPETGYESLAAEESFCSEYGQAVIEGGQQLYGVVQGGHVSADGFAHFMDRMGLPYACTQTSLVRDAEVFAVEEPRVDPVKLDELVRARMGGVVVHCNRQLLERTAKQFDAVVVASYAGVGVALDALNIFAGKYKFQVVEKPVVRMPDTFRDLSIVMIDGPFCCIDPHGSTDLHVLGHVTETVHASNIGVAPSVPDHLRGWLRGGLVKSEHSRFSRVVEAMAQYIPDVRMAEHIGSILTVRAVLPGMEKTDARPTLVDRVGENVIRVFSGKLGTAVVAAKRVMAELRAMEKVAA